MIEIDEVIGRTEQGKSHVYLCRGADQRLRYVKGLVCGRDSQLAEWVCAHLAKELELPFPEFHLVNIPEELFETLPGDQREIGYGPAFATVEVAPSRWFDCSSPLEVGPILAGKVLLFDYWIQNMDRYTDNTNVLVKPEEQTIVLIDHNLAFDSDFNKEDFFNQHIFRDHNTYWTEDMINQSECQYWLNQAESKLEEILEGVPKEWHWKNLETDIPAQLDTDRIYSILSRHRSPDFWRHE